MSKIEIRKNPGADWIIYYVDVADGTMDAMSVFGFPTAAAALVEAEASLTFGMSGVERDWFEIVGVVRSGVNLQSDDGPADQRPGT